MLWRSVIHFFLLLRQIRYKGVMHTLYSPFRGYLGVWSLGSSNAVTLTVCVQFLCGHVLAFLLGTKPKRINGLFDNCMFKWNCQTFPKWICHLHCHQECLEFQVIYICANTWYGHFSLALFCWVCGVSSFVFAFP